MNVARTPLLRLHPAAAAGWLCAALLAATTANAQTWTGKGASKSWNDAANWDPPAAPAPGLSSAFTFDAPDGNAFGFGGDQPFRAASLHFTPRAGRYSIAAPQIVLGGSANEDKADGWILEPIFAPGRVVNESPQAQMFNADVRLGWDTTFCASNGNLVVNGTLDGADFALEKTGAGDLILNEGAANLERFTLKEGRLVLLDAAATLHNLQAENPKSEIILLNGASLVADRADTPDTGSSIYIHSQVQLAGVSKSTGRSCLWDLSGRSLHKCGSPFSLSHGASITNAGVLYLHTLAKQTNGVSYHVEGGSSIFCNGLVIGATDRGSFKNSHRISMTLAGNHAPGAARQTILDLGGRGLNVGHRDESHARSTHHSLTVSNGAKIVNADEFRVPGGIGDSHNTAVVSSGSTLYCKGMRVGLLGSSNRVDITGVGTTLDLDEKPLVIGTVSSWGKPFGNIVRITDRAAVDRVGVVYVGRGTGWGEHSDGDNVLTVDNGARLTSQGALIGCNSGRNQSSTGNRFVIDGRGTRWNASGERILIGNASTGAAIENQIVMANGAFVTNMTTITVGNAAGGKSTDNVLEINNGVQMFSRGAVQIGVVSRESKTNGATDNRIVVAGGAAGPVLWDLGGGDLSVGVANAWNGISRNNRLVLQPGAMLRNVGAVTVGRGQDGSYQDNQIVLAGGVLMAQSLDVTLNNGIGVELGAWKTNPILVEKDVVFGHRTFIAPKATSSAKPGRTLLLAWKGKAEGLDRLKLSPDADQNAWSLEILEPQKQLILRYK
ncbi:MAG: hypothetical protein ACOX9C_09570 [Kiritimatiellia bacterium]|jgi:hypothetical protein